MVAVEGIFRHTHTHTHTHTLTSHQNTNGNELAGRTTSCDNPHNLALHLTHRMHWRDGGHHLADFHASNESLAQAIPVSPTRAASTSKHCGHPIARTRTLAPKLKPSLVFGSRDVSGGFTHGGADWESGICNHRMPCDHHSVFTNMLSANRRRVCVVLPPAVTRECWSPRRWGTVRQAA